MTSLFEDAGGTPFKNRDALKDKYVPDQIVGREAEKEAYANSLTPILNGFSPDNVFLIGPSGVGKTALTNHILDDLKSHDGMDHLTIQRVNCDGMGGETTLMLEIANEFREPGEKHATTGYKKATARDLMFEEINNAGGTVILVLDELDTVSELDTFLYQVPRAHETGKLDEDVDVGLIGISNDPRFLDDLPDDVQNTLTDEPIHFTEYAGDELREVLAHRAALAFKDTELETDKHGNTHVESDVLTDDVVPVAAAHSAKNTGDARMGITLLRKAGDLARDEGEESIGRDYIDRAVEEYQREQISESVEGLQYTAKVVLHALVRLTDEKRREDGGLPRTSEVADLYAKIHADMGEDPVSRRQVRKHLSKLDSIGVCEKVEQKGGGAGTYTEHRLCYEPDIIREAIPEVGTDTTLEAHQSEQNANAD